MLAKDSVQVRLERGLSFTEFSYMLLQASDFEHLYRTMGVELQMGGADQWGNITAGLELIRRADGRRGRSERAGPRARLQAAARRRRARSSARARPATSVWLDPARTSPYAFYQYWLNTDDRDVGTYLRWFTAARPGRDRGARGRAAGAPEARAAQRALARDITARTHGEAAAAQAIARLARRCSRASRSRTRRVLRVALRRDRRVHVRPDAGCAAGRAVLLAEPALFASTGEARRMIAGGRRDDQRRRGSTDAERRRPGADRRASGSSVRIGKRRREIGRGSRSPQAT